MKRKPQAVDRPDLQALLAKWHPRICPDWRVSAEYGDFDRLQGDSGAADVVLTRRILKIQVLDPMYTPASHVPQDVEETLVHELLHGPFHHLKPEEETADYTLWEQLIEQVSVLLVALDRKARR